MTAFPYHAHEPRHAIPELSEKWYIKALYITGALASIVAILIAVTSSLHTWIFSVPDSISISPPSSGSIPRCATISGTAWIPSGDTLWVAQQGAGEILYYNLTEASFVRPGVWRVTMTVGRANDINQAFTIYAFALDSQATEMLDSMKMWPSGSFYALTSLPHGALETHQTMQRDMSMAACN